MKRLFLIVFFSMSLLLCYQAVSQNLSLDFDHITMDDGLSQSTVYGIVQDKYGFMWFGTQDGLNRYDGYDFKYYKHDPLISSSISFSYITSMLLDSQNNIWVGTGVGLNRYIYETESFVSYFHNEDNDNCLDHNNISCIFESISEPGVLWIGTILGLNKFDIKEEKFTQYNLPMTDSTSNRYDLITTIYESDNDVGILWVGTNNGLYQFHTIKERFRKYISDQDSDELSNYYINVIFEDSFGKLWIGTSNGLNIFESDNNRVTTFKNELNNPNSLSHNNIKTIYEDSNNNLWIGTLGGGLNLFQRETRQFQRWIDDPGNPNSISANEINIIHEDKTGILWIGTAIKGIKKANLKAKKFIHYYNNPNDDNSLVYNSVRAIYKDNKDILWIGTDNGLSCLNEKTGIFKNYTNIPGNSNILNDKSVRVITQGKNGIFWFGTRFGGLHSYDQISGALKHYEKDINNNQSIGSNYIRAIFEDNNGILWIGTVDGGLNRFDPESELFKHYLHDPDNINSLPDNKVYSIISDKNRILWLGTGDGLVKFDPEKEEFTRYLDNRADTTSQIRHLVMSVFEGVDDFIWAATFGGGLYRLDQTTGIFTRYTEKDGLSNNIVYGIVPDDDDNFWMSTNSGISKFNTKTQEFNNYTVKDGVQAREFNSGAYYKDNAGEIYFGGINGLNIINPESIKYNEVIPTVLITDFQLFNKSVQINDTINNRIILTKSIIETDTIKLSFRQNILSFSFVALDYYYPEMNEYEYKLEKIEEEWNKVGDRRFITYSSLPPGEYTFRVRGSNSDGKWNEEGKSLKIFISPPWWRTIIFYVLTSLFVVILFILYIRNREKKLLLEKSLLEKKVNQRTKDLFSTNKELKEKQAELELKQEEIYTQNENLEELNATKDKFFSIIAHDLINPFNIIMGYSNLLKSNYYDFPDDKRKFFINEIDKSSKNTFDLLKNLLDWASTQQGKIKIQKEKLNLFSVVNNGIKPLISCAEIKEILIKTDISKNIYINADSETILIVINNLVSNAIKFTPKGGEILINTETNKDKIILCIKDTGVGMTKEILDNLFRIDKSYSTRGTNDEKGTGLGLFLVKEFIEKNDARIFAESKVDEGSIFKLEFPNF